MTAEFVCGVCERAEGDDESNRFGGRHPGFPFACRDCVMRVNDSVNLGREAMRDVSLAAFLRAVERRQERTLLMLRFCQERMRHDADWR